MKNQADILVKYAEQEARRSRAQFFSTLAEIRHRADPRVIIAESAENLVGRVNFMLNEAGSSVRSRPVLSFGGVAAFAVAVALRFWLSKKKNSSDAT